MQQLLLTMTAVLGPILREVITSGRLNTFGCWGGGNTVWIAWIDGWTGVGWGGCWYPCMHETGGILLNERTELLKS